MTLDAMHTVQYVLYSDIVLQDFNVLSVLTAKYSTI